MSTYLIETFVYPSISGFDSLAPPSVSVLVPLVSLKCLNFKAD